PSARAPGLNPSASWWDELRVYVSAVQQLWPATAHTAALLFQPDGLPPEPEMLLADAWRWCVFAAATLVANGPSTVDWRKLGDDVEQELFMAFLAGELECLGRRDPDRAEWKPLPQDWFRLPVELRVNHNILEPSGQGSMEDFILIRKDV